MTAGPEHFAPIALRHFIRLREIQMIEQSPISANTRDHNEPDGMLPSAIDHYRDACRLLAEADGTGYNLGERRARIDAVEQYVALARLALRIWPAKMTELLAVADAARRYLAADADDPEAGAQCLALGAALSDLDAAA